MHFLQRAARAIDRLNGALGQAMAWLTVLMVFFGAFNAIARYSGRFMSRNLSSNAYIEAQWYLFSVLFLLGAAWALREDAHVRVDVFYARASHRVRAWTDILGMALLLIPFCLFMLWTSWPSVRNSWLVREVSPDPGGLPRYPLKALLLVSFALLLLQGVSELIKAVDRLRSGADVAPEHHVEGV